MTGMLRFSLILVCSLALAAEGDADPLLALPVLEPVQPAPAEPLGEVKPVAPGIATSPTAVVLDGTILVDSGPVDGLEVMACLTGGKDHESLVRLQTTNGQLVKFAAIRVLGADDGIPAIEASGQPARGTPVRLRLQWPEGDPEGPWREVDVSCLVRDRVTDRPYPRLPFVYTGSRIITTTEVGVDGRQVKLNRFMLDTTKSVAVAFDEPDTLLASPFPGTAEDSRFEAYGAIVPRPGTRCRLLISAADLPLTLRLAGDGSLRADEAVLDDAALDRALAAAFPADFPGLRAVAVQVAASVEPARDVAARTRILAAAARAQVWAVPVFVLAP